MTLFHPRRCVTLVFSLTLTSACGLTFSGLSPVATISVIVCFPDSVLTKLDFGNTTLAGLPTNLLNRLQSVLNVAARSIAGLRR